MVISARPATRAKIERVERYPQKRGALLPAIHLVQAEKGYVDAEGAHELAALFEIEPVEVLEVVSFYNMFYTEPQGRHHVYVCTNLPCSLRGARTLLHGLEAHLGVHARRNDEGRAHHDRPRGVPGRVRLRADDARRRPVPREPRRRAAARRIVDGLE